jgi:light-regulated signal transduction histidine kinase (bacteriophytochrome)
MPRVKADATQLTQLLQNLVGNALKFRRGDPPAVHVSARLAEGADGRSSSREWVFSVRDNGLGIEPQYFERIFEIFQRLHTREEYDGSGIGLAVCKRILERHGGRIWIESEPGKGSTFFFTLPYTEFAAP